MRKFNGLVLSFCLGGVFLSCINQETPIVFSAIGDVPYSDQVVKELDESIANHNESTESSFIIHLGDIKPGSKPCDERVYKNVSTQLKKVKTASLYYTR